MTIEDQIKDEKLQYDISREAAKISTLSSGKIDKYKYLTDEEILPSNQQQKIQQAKFNYSPLGKAFEKQTKTFEDQGKKQVDALNVDKAKMVYKSTGKTYHFRGFKTIRTYGNDIRNNVTSLSAANLEQANLLARVQDFVKKNPRGS